MARWQGIVVGVVLLGSALLGVAQAQTRVDGYYRSNGTYVQPHLRSAPDGIPTNNYGYPGNYNPNSGQITGGDPARYLQHYQQPTPMPGLQPLQPLQPLPQMPRLR